MKFLKPKTYEDLQLGFKYYSFDPPKNAKVVEDRFMKALAATAALIKRRSKSKARLEGQAGPGFETVLKLGDSTGPFAKLLAEQLCITTYYVDDLGTKSFGKRELEFIKKILNKLLSDFRVFYLNKARTDRVSPANYTIGQCEVIFVYDERGKRANPYAWMLPVKAGTQGNEPGLVTVSLDRTLKPFTPFGREAPVRNLTNDDLKRLFDNDLVGRNLKVQPLSVEKPASAKNLLDSVSKRNRESGVLAAKKLLAEKELKVKKLKNGKVEIEIDLPVDLIKWAKSAAKKQKISFNKLINNAVKDFIRFHDKSGK